MDTVDSTIRLRPAFERDKHAVASIYNEGIADGNATFDDSPVEAGRYDTFFASESRARIICAVRNELVVGWGSVEPRSDRAAYRYTGQLAVYISREYRGRGIGQRLTTAVEEVARNLNYHSLLSENLSTNRISLLADLASGYHFVGEVREAGFRDGRWIDLFVMQKMLNAADRCLEAADSTSEVE